MSVKKSLRVNWFIYRLVLLILFVFTKRFRISAQVPPEVKKLKAPYLVLGNHVGFWDPFIGGYFLPHVVQFVSSDVAFRSPLFRFFLTRLGTIPKKKLVRDSQVIRDILSVIENGNCVGIYPEAVRNWAGRSFPLDPSIAKLVKMLKVPVVVPLLKGMNLCNPRWSKIRRAQVQVEYQLVLNRKEVLDFDRDQIFKVLEEALFHDEVDFQRKAMIPIRSQRRAEFISHALYLCPECGAIDSFRCSGNDFACSDCGYALTINPFGFFELAGGRNLHFDNIRAWYYWQEKELTLLVEHYLEKGNIETPVMVDEEVKIFKSLMEEDLKLMGTGRILLFKDRVELQVTAGETEILWLDKMQTINPQVFEKLEIFYERYAYRVIGLRPGLSALKYEVAVNAIWRKLGQKNKLSPYINP